jgi:hypothetical protein
MMASTDDILDCETNFKDSDDTCTSCAQAEFRSNTTALGLGITQIVLGISIVTLWAVSIKDSSLYIAPEGQLL